MIVLTVGDTKPDLAFQLVRGGAPINLTGCTVVFKLRRGDLNIITRSLSITDALNGKVAGNFQAGDLSVAGAAQGELVVTFPGGTVQHSEEPFDVFIRAEYTDPVR